MGARVTFPASRDAAFIAAVRLDVADYFAASKLTDKANGSMVVKTAILATSTVAAYGLLLSNWMGPWAMLCVAALLGVGIAGLGFCVAHDALHEAYSDRPWLNRALGYVFDVCGANGYMWRITHNGIHHTYTNIHGVDEDLTVSPILRLSPHAEWRPLHRYQHLYAFFAYTLSTLFWVFVKDYRYFLRRDLGPYAGLRHPRSEWLILLSLKALYYAWSLVIPLMLMSVSWWQFLIGWLTMHVVAGGILGGVFQLAHVVEETSHPEPDEGGRMESDWQVHQMRTTSNFATANGALSWFVGGLNHQIEHHLFPKICSVHYPAIRPIVMAAAAAHGVRYNEHTTLMQAAGSHFRTLKWLSVKPEDV